MRVVGDLLGGLPYQDAIGREQELQPTELLGRERRRDGQLLGDPMLDLHVTFERGDPRTAAGARR